MTRASIRHERFDAARLAGIEEPVRCYLTHALADGADLAGAVRLEMVGRIRVGAWLEFDSVWAGDGRSFSWTATAGVGRFRFLRAHDQFGSGVGFMDIRVRPPLRSLPALKVVHAENEDATRSGAGRAALEAMWVPAALLPERGVEWRVESPDHIVAGIEVPPERADVHFMIEPNGAVRACWTQRWQNSKTRYVPFGVDVQAERTFGGMTIPSRLTAGWGYGTPDWSAFIEAEVIAADQRLFGITPANGQSTLAPSQEA